MSQHQSFARYHYCPITPSDHPHVSFLSRTKVFKQKRQLIALYNANLIYAIKKYEPSVTLINGEKD